MITKYRTWNVNTTQYVDTDTIEEAIELVRVFAKEFYFTHTHGKPIIKTEYHDDGSMSIYDITPEEKNLI